MRRRTLFLTAAGAIIAGAGVVVAMLRPDPPPVQGPQPALPVLAANYRAADRIEVLHGQRVLWLERRGQVWGLAQSGGYPVRPDAAAALIDGLLALTLDRPAAGSPGSLGVADPTATEGAGTLVRVLAVSGAVLGAIILGPETGPAYVRRPGLPAIWLAGPHVTASSDPADWTGRQVPMPAAVPVTADGTRLRQWLAGLRFSEVRASPQIRAEPLQAAQLALADGTAALRLGRLDGQSWLQISGTSAWARQLSPYAFAISAGTLPGDSL